MPIDWPQVESGLDPKRFTVRTAPALLKKSKAWNDYDASARSLKRRFERSRSPVARDRPLKQA